MARVEILAWIAKEIAIDLALKIVFEIGKLIRDIKVKNTVVQELLYEFLKGVTQNVKSYIPASVYRM